MKDSRLSLVVDIETRTDETIVGDDFPKDKFSPNIAQYIISLSAATFVKGAFPNDQTMDIRSLSSAKGNEAEMLRSFISYVDKKRPRLVGFNSKGFDLEVIKGRCLVHGIQFPTWFQTGTKWESYRSRFSSDWQLDLMDFMTSFGASPRFSLELASRAIGIPGKLGMNGAEVADYYAQGKIEEITNYCETDVMATSALMLRVMHLTGELSSEGFAKSAKSFLDFLQNEALEKPHFQTFLEQIDLEKFTGVVTSLEDAAISDNVRLFPRGTSACSH